MVQQIWQGPIKGRFELLENLGYQDALKNVRSMPVTHENNVKYEWLQTFLKVFQKWDAQLKTINENFWLINALNLRS